MKTIKAPLFLWNPVFRVIATWVWWVIGASITLWMIIAASGVHFTELHTIYRQFPHLLIYVELVGVGLFPLALTLACRDDLALYGIKRNHLLASLFWSMSIVAANGIYFLLTTGRWMSWRTLAVHVDFPGNIYYALLGMFTYGPLEMFFVVWLITHTERVIRGQFLSISLGLIATVILVGMAHLATASGIQSALYVTIIFFLLGLVFRRTGNSIGPMLAWTVINGQVWFLVQFLWT